MTGEVYPIASSEARRRAGKILRAGKLVVLPTDTVYGVAAHPRCPEAIVALYAAKNRPQQKAIPILLSDARRAEAVAQPLLPAARKLAAALWPGPLTLVVPKRDDLSPLVSTLTTVGLRVPDHDAARAVIAEAGGALAVTSANLSGKENAVTVEAAIAQLGDAVALYLDGGTCAGGVPSTVVRVDSSGAVEILREGPISEDTLRAVCC